MYVYTDVPSNVYAPSTDNAAIFRLHHVKLSTAFADSPLSDADERLATRFEGTC